MAEEDKLPELAPTEAAEDPALAQTHAAGAAHGLATLAVGLTLGGRYRIERFLGEGGMGAVYLARDGVLEQEVALKAVRLDGAGGLERLRDEVRLAQRVSHPNVGRTYDLEEVEGRFLLKMAFVEGETLAARIGREGRLAIREALRIAREVAAGLGAAHAEGVVHRDLKPNNIMLEAGSGRAVLMDFGLARAASLAGRAAEGISGTPAYMAPEQARGIEVDGRADLYALGCVLFQMLVGEVVFPGAGVKGHLEGVPRDPRAVRAEVPEWVSRIVLKLLEKEPGRRFGDARAVGLALEGPVRGRKRRGVAIAVAVLAAAGAGVGIQRAARRGEWRPVVRDVLPAYEENSDTPVISPDGRRIAYPSDREVAGRVRIYVGSIDGGASRAVTPAEIDAFQPRWTKDGRALLFVVVSDLTARRVELEGGRIETVAAGALGIDACGEGTIVTYGTAPGCPTCWRIVARGPAEERELYRTAAGETIASARCDAAGSQVVFSPNRQGGGVHVPSDVWIVPVAGGEARPLTGDARQENHFATFAPDGKSVLFTSTREGASNLWEMAVAGGEAVQRTFGPGPDYAPDVSPDGRTVIFDLDVTSIPLFAQAVAGGRPRKLSSTLEDLSLMAVSPEGRELVAAARRSGKTFVVVLPLEGEERVLGEGTAPAFTLDGREVVFAREGGLAAVAREGGVARALAAVPGRVEALTVGPDGAAHARVLRETGAEAWRVPLDGGAAAREAEGPWCQVLPAPVGGWRAALTCRGVKSEAYLVAPGAELGAPSGPAAVTGRRFTWTADGRALVYWTGTEVRRLAVADRSERKLLATGGTMGLAVSPDEKTIYVTEIVSHVRRQVITNFAERPRPWAR